MNIQISDKSFYPEIPDIIVDGKDIVKYFEIAKIAVEVIKGIGMALISFARELGLIPDMSIHELGDRVIQGLEQGVNPENYSSMDEWIAILGKDDWGFDEKIKSEHTIDEKVVMGLGIISGLLIEKCQQFSLKDFIMKAPDIKGLFTVERMVKLAELSKTDPELFETVLKYISGKDKSKMVVDKATDYLVAMEKDIDPELSDNEAYFNIVHY